MPRLAVRAILIEQDRILLAHFVDAGGEWYVVPGGGVQHGETIEEAFHRELQEEIGARAEFDAVASAALTCPRGQAESHRVGSANNRCRLGAPCRCARSS